MATYSYNGKIILKNSKREDYRYACINKETGEKFSISATATGAASELNRTIRKVEEHMANYNRALVAIDFGKSYYFWKDGKHSEKMDIEKPREYYAQMIEEERSYIEKLKSTYIIVEVEKS